MVALAAQVSRGFAQEPRGFEAGIETVVTLADPVFASGGASLGLRPGGGTRVVLNVLPGVERGRIAARGELLAQLMLAPAQPRGIGFYGLAGIAGQAGPRDAGWLVLGLGMEGAPAAGSGWHLEAGIGGGVRISAGWRWRRLRRRNMEVP